VQTHAPEEKDHRGEKHNVEDEVFVHASITRKGQSAEGIASKIPNSKSQISSESQFQMTKKILFRI
jgi:hypothetical protein